MLFRVHDSHTFQEVINGSKVTAEMIIPTHVCMISLHCSSSPGKEYEAGRREAVLLNAKLKVLCPVCYSLIVIFSVIVNVKKRLYFFL